MSFTVGMRMQRLYFDQQQVVSRLGQKITRDLNRGGTLVRRQARKMLGRKRKRGGVSAAGRPPYVHTDDERITLRNIQYHSNGATSILIGPVGLNVHSLTRIGSGPGAENVLTRSAVPGILEHGGTVGYRVMQGADGQWARVPWGNRRRPHRLVPVWLATAAEKQASTGVHTVRSGRRAINYYIVPNGATRIHWARIEPRPWMGPSLEKVSPKVPYLFAHNAPAIPAAA